MHLVLKLIVSGIEREHHQILSRTCKAGYSLPCIMVDRVMNWLQGLPPLGTHTQFLMAATMIDVTPMFRVYYRAQLIFRKLIILGNLNRTIGMQCCFQILSTSLVILSLSKFYNYSWKDFAKFILFWSLQW